MYFKWHYYYVVYQNYQYTRILLPVGYKDVNKAQYSIWRPTQKVRHLHSKYQSKCSMISLKWLAPYFRGFNSLPKLSNNIIFGLMIRNDKYHSFLDNLVVVTLHTTYFLDIFEGNYSRNRDNCCWNHKPEYQNPYHVSYTSLIGMPIGSTSWISNQNRIESELFINA